MSDPIKRTSRIRQYSIVFIIVVILFCLCDSTAYYPRGFPEGSLAEIPKIRLETNASREAIVTELVDIWMNKYRIGSLGWIDWIWTYEVENIDIWDSPSECVNITFKLVTVLPSDWTRWAKMQTTKDGVWLKNSHTFQLTDFGNFYELSGPYGPYGQQWC